MTARVAVDGVGTWAAEGAVTRAVWFDDPVPVDMVPVPAAALLFGSGLLGFISIARRKKS